MKSTNSDKASTWVLVLVMIVIFLIYATFITITLAEKRKEDVDYFKNRIALLENRINQQDKRLDAYEDSIFKIKDEVKEITTLVIQINANVLENSKRLEDILNPPKPLIKKGKPKSAFKPEKLYTPPIQGPRPEPPIHSNKGIPHIEGKQ